MRREKNTLVQYFVFMNIYVIRMRVNLGTELIMKYCTNVWGNPWGVFLLTKCLNCSRSGHKTPLN